MTSAGGGSESLLKASRSALVDYAEQLPMDELVHLLQDLTEIVRQHITNDRLVVPTLEVLSFLFDAGLFHRIEDSEK